jgi:diacylglycerol kinase (ATP)
MVIANPAAGHGRGRSVAEKLEAAFRKRGIPYELRLTRSSGEATILAREARRSTVVAVGGDGTVHEVANGLAGSDKVLAVIPAGSGNDFVKSIGVPRTFAGALDALLTGKIKEIDLGEVALSGNSTSMFFVNGVGLGFDASVADRTRQIRLFSGTLLYVIAVLQTLGRYEAPLFSTVMDDCTLEARNLLIAVGNGTCAGGGFYLTPEARNDDGLLDVCMIRDISAGKILRIMPLVMKGEHRKLPEVHYAKSRHISISTNLPEVFTVHADGEIVGREIHSVRVFISDKQLAVIAGPSI